MCMFCQMIEEELELNERIVLVTEHFVAIEPFASPTPFCTHIYPRRHMASFGDSSAQEMADLGRVLRTLLAKLYHGLQDPDFNVSVRTAPAECVGVKYFHPLVSERDSEADPRCRIRTWFRHVHQYDATRDSSAVLMQREGRRDGGNWRGHGGCGKVMAGTRPSGVDLRFASERRAGGEVVRHFLGCASLPNTYSLSGPKRRFSM